MILAKYKPNTIQMEVIKAIENAKHNSSLVTIEATIDTGFEDVALEECKEVFGSTTFVIKGRGRLYFNIFYSEYHKVSFCFILRIFF